MPHLLSIPLTGSSFYYTSTRPRRWGRVNNTLWTVEQNNVWVCDDLAVATLKCNAPNGHDWTCTIVSNWQRTTLVLITLLLTTLVLTTLVLRRLKQNSTHVVSVKTSYIDWLSAGGAHLLRSDALACVSDRYTTMQNAPPVVCVRLYTSCVVHA